MKVKRFLAASMAEALKQVRADMGPDAVILSNRKVEGGVEIVTALDYDENKARQRLGDAGLAATNGSRLAELQAEQHRRLEQELGRSRERILEVREKRAANVDPVVPRSDELATMRAEISSLRDLVQARPAVAANVTPAAEPTGVAEQRLIERLQEFGLSYELAGALARNHGNQCLEDGWRQALKTLAAGVKTSPDEWMHTGGVYALVGPTGSGKTTTIGKLAARYVLQHGADSLAMVTTDRYRIAAHEQLFIFGRILNVPVRVVDDCHSLDAILDELSDRHLVLIDTAGLTPSDKGYQQQLTELAQSRHGIRSHLVVAATSQPRIMKSVWHCYKITNLAGCVLTKLDEALTLGEALGFAVETSLPVAYYTDGQKIPEDLHPASAGPLVRQAVDRLKQMRQQQTMAAGA